MFKISGAATMARLILCALHAATGPPASALDRRMELTNNTRMAIAEIFASPVGTNRWGQDLLGDALLLPATSVLVKFDDTATGDCRFDFKVVFDDGTTRIGRNINVCAAQRYGFVFR